MQMQVGAFVKLKAVYYDGAQGRLAAVNSKSGGFSVEFPDPTKPCGMSDTEAAVNQATFLGPASDPELCAWWDGAVREACSRARPPSASLPASPPDPL